MSEQTHVKIIVFIGFLLSLVENITVVNLVDGNSWSPLWVTIIMVLDPLLRETVALVTVKIPGQWDNLCGIIVTEALQAGLFIHFSSNKDVAKVIFIIEAAVQVILAIIALCLDWDNEEDVTHKICCRWVCTMFLELDKGIMALLFLTFHAGAIFRSPFISSVIAFMASLVPIQVQTFTEDLPDDMSQEKMNAMKEQMEKHPPALKKRIVFLFFCGFVANFCIYVASWMYVFSPEMLEGWETRYTIAYIVLNSLMIPCQLLTGFGMCKKLCSDQPNATTQPSPAEIGQRA